MIGGTLDSLTLDVEVDCTFTRAELLAARERPPLTPADVAGRVHTTRYKGTGKRGAFAVPRPPVPCGTLSRYAHGCRCIPCRNARRAYDRARRERRELGEREKKAAS